MVINLFIAVVINNFEEAKKENAGSAADGTLEKVRLELEQTRASLERLSKELNDFEQGNRK